METNYSYEITEKEIFDFFDKVEIPVFKPKEEVWKTISSSLGAEVPTKKIFLNQRIILGIAASLLILAGIISFLRFYTQTISNPAGKYQMATLSDGSTVELNAGSTLTYHPYWFTFSRNLQFEGEGFFQVEKGKQFTVESKLGKTIVLGTSFNIYSRSEGYKVFCQTGKVKVVSTKNSEVILVPGQMAEVDQLGKIKVSENITLEEPMSWRDNMFNFVAAPIQTVFEEIERQYNITITNTLETELYYTGHFSREKPVEEVLSLICKPFGINFVKKSENKYLVTQN
ncbi:MAG TPA: FecR domain-containing protein [Bacteroidales bacterium]